MEGAVISWGATHEVKVQLATTASELASVLDISGSIDVGGFAGGSGALSAKAQYFNDVKGTSTSSYLVVSAQNSRTFRLRDPRMLSDGSIITPKDTNFDLGAFLSTHGDSFVEEVLLGGEYICVYTFETRTKQEQLFITGEIKASGMLGPVSTEDDVEGEFDRRVNESGTSFTVRRRAPAPPGPNGTCSHIGLWRLTHAAPGWTTRPGAPLPHRHRDPRAVPRYHRRHRRKGVLLLQSGRRLARAHRFQDPVLPRCPYGRACGLAPCVRGKGGHDHAPAMRTAPVPQRILVTS